MCARPPRGGQALLDEHGVAGIPKTTGNRGIHVYVRLQPRWTSYEVRSAAVAVARELERRRPDLMTAAWWKEERGQRVFIDYNQNAPHKTIFGAWSVRGPTGRAGLDAVRWDELDDDPPGRADDRDGPGPAGARRRSVGRDDDAPQSLEPLLAHARARPRRRATRRAWPPVYPKQPDEPPRVAPSRARRQD